MKKKTRRRGLRMGDQVIITNGEHKDYVGTVYGIKRGDGAKLYRIALNNDIGQYDILVPRERFISSTEDKVMEYTRGNITIHEGEPAPHRMPIEHDRIGTNLLKGHKIVLCHRDYKKIKRYLQFTNEQIILYPYSKRPYLVLSPQNTQNG